MATLVAKNLKIFGVHFSYLCVCVKCTSLVTTSSIQISVGCSYLVLKWLLFLAAAPAAIIANITRLTTTAILASRYGSAVADGFLHDFSGLFTIFVGLAMLLLANKILCRKSTR